MNLIRKTLVILLTLNLQICYSQLDSLGNTYPKMMIIESDTVIVYSLEQARELTLRNEERKECLILSELSAQQLSQQDTIIKAQEEKIDNLNLIVDNKDTIIEKKQSNLNICEEEKSIKDKEIRKQKIGKWVAIGAAAVIGVFGIIF